MTFQMLRNGHEQKFVATWSRELVLVSLKPPSPSPGVIPVTQMTVANDLVPETPETGQDPAASRMGPPNQVLRDGELLEQMPLFFNQDTYGNGDHFGDFLKPREMNRMSDLFILGSLKALQLAVVFEEDTEPFLLHHLAMIMMLMHYLKAHMLELVETQALRTKLAWKKVESNGFQSTHFKIHMRGVHETHVAALESILHGSKDDDDVEIARNKWSRSIRNEDPKPAITDNKILQCSSINPKLFWNSKISTFDTYKSHGPYNMGWTTS